MSPEEEEITEEDLARAKVVADRLLGKRKLKIKPFMFSEALNDGTSPSAHDLGL